MKLNSITLGLVAALTISTTISAQDDNQAKYDKKITGPWIESGGWELDYDKALATATSEGKYVLAYFSRSYSP